MASSSLDHDQGSPSGWPFYLSTTSHRRAFRQYSKIPFRGGVAIKPSPLSRFNAPCLRLLLALSLCCALMAGACAPKASLKPASIDERIAAQLRSALDSNSPSERTKVFLLQMELTETWSNDPMTVLVQLHKRAHEDKDRETLFALAELTYLQAKRSRTGSDESAKLFLSCAIYSWRYLFDPLIQPPMQYYNPYERVAAMFYNRSITELMRYSKAKGLRHEDGGRLPMLVGEVELNDRLSELDIPAQEVDDFLLSYEFKVQGLDPQMLTMGIGVPMVVVRKPPRSEERSAKDRFMPSIEQAYAATCLLRILPRNGEGLEPDAQGVYKADLEFYDPMQSEYVVVQGHRVPLETDMTTPLAYTIEKSPSQNGIQGMISPEAWENQQGLYTLQSYRPGRIPVVFVHGLMSSPDTWLPMLNLLMNDPVLRKHYQFWFFKYPTGNPVLHSAAILRESLQEAVRTFDPEGKDPALGQMLLVGHSMGGLLSKLMVVPGGDKLWNLYTDVPLDKLDIQNSDRELIRRAFYFEPLPCVSRVIFMATPHRGSDLAIGVIGKIGRWLITLPMNIMKTAANVFVAVAKASTKSDRPGAQSLDELEKSITGIDSLSPNNQILRYYADSPITAVPFHSIIGNNRKAGEAGGTDGIVPYDSAHLDGARSELIVLSGHSVQERPLAIREVRRIMLEHLKELGLRGEN